MARGDKNDRVGEVSASDLVGMFLSGDAMAKAGENRKVGVAWYKANGDTERRHTTGVFIKDDVNKGHILCVYVDSNAIMVEFNAMRQMYLARLEAQGIHVDGIQFLLSREGYHTWMDQQKDENEEDKPLPELSREEERRVAELVPADLPEELRAKVERAIRLSYRREKEIDSSSSPRITDSDSK